MQVLLSLLLLLPFSVVVGARYAKVAAGAFQPTTDNTAPSDLLLLPRPLACSSACLPLASLLSSGICVYQYTGFMCLYCEFEVSLAVRAFLGQQQQQRSPGMATPAGMAA